MLPRFLLATHHASQWITSPSRKPLTSCSDPRRFDPSIDGSRMEQLLFLEHYIHHSLSARIYSSMISTTRIERTICSRYSIRTIAICLLRQAINVFSLVSFIVWAQRGLSIIGQNLEENWNGMRFSVEMFGCFGVRGDCHELFCITDTLYFFLEEIRRNGKRYEKTYKVWQTRCFEEMEFILINLFESSSEVQTSDTTDPIFQLYERNHIILEF